MKKLEFPVITTKRSQSGYTIDSKLSRHITTTLKKIKGRVDQEIAQSGKLDTNEFIKFRLSRKSGQIPNMNIFNQTVEKHGLDVYLLLDCSYSMATTNGQLNNIASTIYKALDDCTFIIFHVICYSGSFSGSVYIQELNKIGDCTYITPDRNNRGTPTHLALNYIHDKIKKLENKKLVILFTDGLPEDEISYDKMQADIKKQVVKMKNDHISFFTIFYVNHEYNKAKFGIKNASKMTQDIINKMRDMFKGSLYETDNFEGVQKIMIKQLMKSVEKINQN